MTVHPGASPEAGEDARAASPEPSAAFTPGPWFIKPSAVSQNLCIYSGTVRDYIGGYGIGEAWNLNGEPQNLANARLIAAAPDMYEALKAIRAEQAEGYCCDATRSMADAALAKAEGQS